MYNDLVDYFMFAMLGVLVLGVAIGVGVVVVAAVDGVYELSARSAVFACEARNLQPVRKTFSTEVACRARNTGADTLNLKTVQ